MKAISNIKEMLNLLNAESTDWQKQVYDATATIPVVSKGQENHITLFSNCGYIDLDTDAEYSSYCGKDSTDYCEIKTVDELINYIHSMPSYRDYLVDENLGTFYKADLFWGIWSAIITAPENLRHNDGSIKEEWALCSMNYYKEHFVLQIALVDYDMTEIWLDLSETTTLQDALSVVVSEMNETTEDIDDIPTYSVYPEEMQQAPRSYEELRKKLLPDGEFNWLTI